MPVPYISSMKNMCRSTAHGATAFTARSIGKYEFYLTMASMMPLMASVLPDMSAEWTTEPCAPKQLRRRPAPTASGRLLLQKLIDRTAQLFHPDVFGRDLFL